MFSGAGDALSHTQKDEQPSAPAQEEREYAAEPEWGHDGMDWPASGSQRNPRDPNDESDADAGELQAAATSLRDHLISQLALSQLSGRDRLRVAFLVEALNDDGYLAQALEELVDVLPEDFAGESDEILEDLSIALKHLQNLDPPGVGARNPRECLLLQLANLPRLGRRIPWPRPSSPTISNNWRTAITRSIKKALGCEDEALRDAQTLIRSLNPRPGAQFAALDTRYIVPDVVVTQAARQLGRQSQPGGHAAPAHQPALRQPAAPATQQRRQQSRRPVAGSQVADQERAAAFRYHRAASRRPSSIASAPSSTTAKWRCGR